MDRETWEIIKAIQESKKSALDEDISIYKNFEAMYFFDGAKLRQIIENTDGGRIYSKLKDIEFIIERLDKTIFKFETIGTQYLEIQDECLVDDFTEYCYLYSSYVSTIVDIYRYLEQNYQIQNNNLREKIFGDDGLGEHNIIHQVIRNSSLHGKLYKPSWSIHYTFEPHTKKITIILSKDSILTNRNCNQKGKIYLERYSDDIDIIEIFKSYLEKVKMLFKVYKKIVYQQYENELSIYHRYENQLNELHQKIKDSLENRAMK